MKAPQYTREEREAVVSVSLLWLLLQVIVWRRGNFIYGFQKEALYRLFAEFAEEIELQGPLYALEGGRCRAVDLYQKATTVPDPDNEDEVEAFLMILPPSFRPDQCLANCMEIGYGTNIFTMDDTKILAAAEAALSRSEFLNPQAREN